MSEALELAGRLLSAVEGDEALALVHRERSGLARFARSEVHQPTLIENDVLELQIVRGGRLGVAVSNRIDDEGMQESNPDLHLRRVAEEMWSILEMVG